MSASAVHEQLVREGVPVISIREREGSLDAVLRPGATEAQIARAFYLCAHPPAPTIDDRARDLARDPELVTALAILLRSKPAPKGLREWAQARVDAITLPGDQLK